MQRILFRLKIGRRRIRFQTEREKKVIQLLALPEHLNLRSELLGSSRFQKRQWENGVRRAKIEITLFFRTENRVSRSPPQFWSKIKRIVNVLSGFSVSHLYPRRLLFSYSSSPKFLPKMRKHFKMSLTFFWHILLISFWVGLKDGALNEWKGELSPKGCFIWNERGHLKSPQNLKNLEKSLTKKCSNCVKRGKRLNFRIST